jgi:hypothetical protein
MVLVVKIANATSALRTTVHNMTFSYFNLLSSAVAPPRKMRPTARQSRKSRLAVSDVIIGRYIDTITQYLTLCTRTFCSFNNPKRTIVALIG